MRSALSLLLLLVLVAVMLEATAAPRDARTRVSADVTTLRDIQADVEAETSFGSDVAARLLGEYPLVDDPQLNHYLNLVGNAVASRGSRPELTYHFALVQSDSINAFAAPGGYIFVTTGAFRILQDEAELAAVLAHEVAHVNQKHIVKELGVRGFEATPEAGISRLLGGSSDPARMVFAQAVDRAVEILFKSGLKQQDEFEADHLGLLTLAFSDYDPRALSRYLKRIQSLSGDRLDALSKTHPSFAARLRALDKLLKQENLGQLDGATGQSRFLTMQGRVL